MPNPQMDERTRSRLEMTFSRGFTGGFLHDIDHQAVVEGRFPKKRGLYLGRVVRTMPTGVIVKLEAPLKPGDGVVFDAGRPDVSEQGGRVYGLRRGSEVVERFETSDPHDELLLTFGDGRVELARVNPGDRVWKTSDPEIDRELRASFEGEQIHYQRPIDACVSGKLGEPLHLRLIDWEGNEVSVRDTEPTQAARDKSLNHDVLVNQLNRMGNTPFFLRNLEADLDGELMVPFSRLNQLRRRAVDALIDKRRDIGRSRRIHPGGFEHVLVEFRASDRPTEIKPTHKRHLSVLCRTLEQVEASLAHPEIVTIYTDFEDIRLHREARVLIPRIAGGPRFVPATLRVMKPGEAPIMRKLLEAEPDAVLVRNLAAWHVLRELTPELELIGDYGLNVANDLTARLLHRNGLKLMTPSYDLNIDQLLNLLHHAPAEWFEVTIHQYMPMFHMEHCVFCRYLSTGTDFTNCGRPCETHSLSLRDRLGYEHPVKADAGCRNTVYNAIAQSASEYLGSMMKAGVRNFRIDFLKENGDEARQAIRAYGGVIRGEVDGRRLWHTLKAQSKLGVTRGSLDHA